jgi:glycosyltransferase involved in cell wall biosynthesis
VSTRTRASWHYQPNLGFGGFQIGETQAMKISVLLPTRDRLTLLRHAVESVLRLEDEDFEIVISDNRSSEDVAAYAASLAEHGVVYVRTSRLLPVTDNWNNALEHASGDYLIMLGDDDALMSDYFSTTRQLVTAFDAPDVIYHSALCYAYPDVIPEHPQGYLRSEGYARFLHNAQHSFRLSTDEARSLVQGAMDFRLRYGFNMQFVTISRRCVEELSNDGPFFRSPFPDYYAMNHLFMRANSIVVEPRPLVVIGISSRSYGFFHNNRRENEGRAFLEADNGAQATVSKALLPGTNINDGWLQAMEELHRQLGSPADMAPNYRRYRRLQIIHVFHGHYLGGTVSASTLEELKSHLSILERYFYMLAFSFIAVIARLLPTSARRYVDVAVAMSPRQFPWWDPVQDQAHYRDIIDAVTHANGDCAPLERQAQRGSRLRAAVLRRVLPG